MTDQHPFAGPLRAAMDGVNRRLGIDARSGPRHAPARRTPFVVLVLGLIVGGFALLLLLNTASAANELQRHGLAAQDESIGAQLADLHNQVAASAAPGNLAAAANQLGMVPAGNPAFLVVGADGAVRVMGSPAPVTDIVVAQAPVHHKKKAKGADKTTAAKTTAAKSGKTTPAGGKSTASSGKSASHSPAEPTPTPTPTVTLPGGNR